MRRRRQRSEWARWWDEPIDRGGYSRPLVRADLALPVLLFVVFPLVALVFIYVPGPVLMALLFLGIVAGWWAINRPHRRRWW